jgi:hypothetical protein
LSNRKKFQFKPPEEFSVDLRSMGLFNDNLILVSKSNDKSDYKLCFYPFENPIIKEEPFWEYSRVYDIIIPENLNEFKLFEIRFLICHEKLFVFNQFILIQWNLSKVAFEMQYNISGRISSIVINKDKTVLALKIEEKEISENRIDLYSMEDGIRISSYGWYYFYDISLYNSLLNNLIFIFYS